MSELDKDTQEAWDYTLEMLTDYERYVLSIGELGLAAPQLLYYRDELQEGLEQFKLEKRVDFRAAWEKTKHLDEILRSKAAALVKEIGHANFRQYQIINDPPKQNWWWWINRVVSAPPPAAPAWQFWKLKEKPSEPEPPSAEEKTGD